MRLRPQSLFGSVRRPRSSYRPALKTINTASERTSTSRLMSAYSSDVSTNMHSSDASSSSEASSRLDLDNLMCSACVLLTAPQQPFEPVVLVVLRHGHRVTALDKRHLHLPHRPHEPAQQASSQSHPLETKVSLRIPHAITDGGDYACAHVSSASPLSSSVALRMLSPARKSKITSNISDTSSEIRR